MATVTPYLVFPGTCKEAMGFYQKALGGSITIMQSFGESGMPVPPGCEDRIFNAELQAGDLRLKASDDLPGHDVQMGSHMSLFVTFPDATSKQAAFEALAEGGTIMFPLDDNFGMLKDPYGMQWMFVHGSH